MDGTACRARGVAAVLAVVAVLAVAIAGHRAPPDLLLPEEQASRSPLPERDARSGSTEWFTGDEFTENMWSLDPCGDQIRATDPQPFSVSTVHRAIDVPEDLRQHQRRQLAVYPSPYTAALVMDEFRRLLAECSHTESDSWEDMEWWWVTEDRPDLGDEGIVAASVSRGPSVYPSGERVAVTRVGSLVFLARISAAYDSAELDDGALAVQQVAQWFVDSL